MAEPLNAGVRMDRRKITLLIVLGVLAVLAVAPLFVLQAVAGDKADDGAYRALAAYARSHNGDASYDTEAASALETFERTSLPDGTERLARISDDGETCWVLDVVEGRIGPPETGVRDDCR